MSTWKLKLGIEKKKKSEPTPKEIEEWNVSVADSFALWRDVADTVRNRSDKLVPLVQPVVFKVEPDISGEYSFSFQKFVDELYDR
jgi:hypothetical protein